MQLANVVLYNAPQLKNEHVQGRTVRPSEVTFDAYEAEEGGYYAVAREFSSPSLHRGSLGRI